MIALYLTKCTKQNEHVTAKSLAEYGFCKSFGKNAKMTHDVRGKPYFFGESAAFVSISHSNGMCLAAVSDREIGADIEYMKTGDERLLRLAGRYFTAQEAEYVSTDTHNRFYEIWCKKESYIKYTGEGMSRPLGSFSVLDTELGVKKLTFTSMTYGNYAIAVCANEAVTEPPIFIDELTVTQ